MGFKNPLNNDLPSGWRYSPCKNLGPVFLSIKYHCAVVLVDCLQLSIFCLLLLNFHTSNENRGEAFFFISYVTTGYQLPLSTSDMVCKSVVCGKREIFFHGPHTPSLFTRRALHFSWLVMPFWKLMRCRLVASLVVSVLLDYFPRLRRESVDSLLY